MKSNTQKYIKITALVWGGCFIVFLLVFVLVLWPLHKKSDEIESKYTKVQAEAEEAFIASLEQTKIRMDEIVKKSQDRLGDFVIDTARSSNISHEIIQISNEVGLNIEVKPVAQRNSAFDNCKYVSGQYFQVSFAAGYNEFARFLNKLEKYRPVIFIDTFSISETHQEGDKPVISMSLEVLVAKNEGAERI